MSGIRMEVIVPRELFDVDSFVRVLTNTVQQTSKAIKVDFEVTQQTWDNKAKFSITKIKDGSKIFTTSDQYRFVNDGTRAHFIRPKNARRLAFQPKYKPKTKPKVIGSRQGGSSGQTVYAMQVRHPGTTAREFDKVIADKWNIELPEQMQRAIDAEWERQVRSE